MDIIKIILNISFNHFFCIPSVRAVSVVCDKIIYPFSLKVLFWVRNKTKQTKSAFPETAFVQS